MNLEVGEIKSFPYVAGSGLPPHTFQVVPPPEVVPPPAPAASPDPSFAYIALGNRLCELLERLIAQLEKKERS